MAGPFADSRARVSAAAPARRWPAPGSPGPRTSDAGSVRGSARSAGATRGPPAARTRGGSQLRVRHAGRLVSHGDTVLNRGAQSISLLPMSTHRVSESTGFRLVLIGVLAHAVSDIDCR
ncbi:hypothetical protein GCM10010515_07290 [Streptomyces fructofermentans]|uniref:Uncharacterized protein n=1 Tax=Streptomyces fructofermentans TaxID=152141 RepID=A0A918K1L8_9ACTN|nr:hypothetical protein GCM10010515_07290 [Streptomyces fructofermentans]